MTTRTREQQIVGEIGGMALAGHMLSLTWASWDMGRAMKKTAGFLKMGPSHDAPGENT